MPDTLHALLTAHFGVETSYNKNPLVAQVATTLTRVIGSNPNRVGLTITNAGSASVYLSPDNQAAVGEGLTLSPNGGSVTFTWDEDFEFITSEWYGIASGAASNIMVLEVVIV